ncbi:hypothetical protein V6N13_018535 [Hibiscus sabdariffa]|uniref:Sulfotransferase n=1 Tax=Hibiscus sabdariffa TaxID=183260 RepID=A0ABR2ELQ5_9ROSI
MMEKSIKIYTTRRAVRRVSRFLGLSLLEANNTNLHAKHVQYQQRQHLIGYFQDARLNWLNTLASELQDATDTNKYEASPKHTHMKEEKEKKSLESKLVKLKEAMRKLVTSIFDTIESIKI